MPKIGPHPNPPADFDRRVLPIKRTDDLDLRALIRIHRRGRGAIFFGKTGGNRWDDPLKDFGVLYAGADDYCAFIETFGYATGVNLLEDGDLEERSMSGIPIVAPLDLADLTGSGLAKIGADSRLCDCDFDIAMNWSRSIFSHPAAPDGILYRARHDPGRQAVAVFDRARGKLGAPSLLVDSFMNPTHEVLLGNLLTHYRFGLAS